jgi:SNF2 family DNA or RNA helicase
MALPPRDYQKTAAALALANHGLLVGDELGLGKTVTALAVLSDPKTLPALVVCPTHLPQQWKRECNRFLPELKVAIPKKGKFYDIGKPDIIILNYHKLSGWADHLAPYVTTVIYDEVQELRRTESFKYAAARHISGNTEWRIGLSATPIYNYGGEFFNVMNCVSPGMLGNKAEFMREWCLGYQDERKARIGDPQAFGTYLRDSGRMVVRTKKEVGRELPPLTRIIQEVETSSSALEMIESSAIELAKFVVSKNQKGFDMMRASQEFSNTLRQATGIAKAPYVAEFVKMLCLSTQEKVILFGWHREVYAIWENKLRQLGVAWFTGSESPTKKQKELDRFMTSDHCRVLMMSLRSGSGVDGLQNVCSRAVIGELDWSPQAQEQCIGRVYRDGQLDPVFAYYLTATDGCDPIMIDVLGLKKAQFDGVINPEGKVISKGQIDPNHVKKLAEEYLRRRNIAIPESEAKTA